jgi:hypothetical protein
MSEATKDLEQRLKDAKEYYHAIDCSLQEAARQFDLKNHKTLSNRIYDKHASVSQLGGQNKILSPSQGAVILAYG